MPSNPDTNAAIFQETHQMLNEFNKVRRDKANKGLVALIVKLATNKANLEKLQKQEKKEPSLDITGVILLDSLLLQIAEAEKYFEQQIEGKSDEPIVLAETRQTPDDIKLAAFKKTNDVLRNLLSTDTEYNPTKDDRVRLVKSIALMKVMHGLMKRVHGEQSLAIDFLENTIIPTQELLVEFGDRVKKIETKKITKQTEYQKLKDKVDSDVDNTIPALETRISKIDTAKKALESMDDSSYSDVQKGVVSTLLKKAETKVTELTIQKDKLTRLKNARVLKDNLNTLKRKATITTAEINSIKKQKDLVEANIKSANKDEKPVSEWQKITGEVETFLTKRETTSFETRIDVKDIRHLMGILVKYVGKPGEYEKIFKDKEIAKVKATGSVDNFKILIDALKGLTTLSEKQEKLRDQLVKEAEEIIVFLRAEIEGFWPSSDEIIELVDDIITGLASGITYEKFEKSTFSQEFRKAPNTKEIAKKYDQWGGFLTKIDSDKYESPEKLRHTVNLLRVQIEEYNFVHVESMKDGFVKPPDDEKELDAWWGRATKYKPANVLETLEYYGAIGKHTGAGEKDIKENGMPQDFAAIIRETYMKFFSGSESSGAKEIHLKSGYMVVEEKRNSFGEVSYVFSNAVKLGPIKTNHGLLDKAMLDGEFKHKGKNYKIIDLSNEEYKGLSEEVRNGIDFSDEQYKDLSKEEKDRLVAIDINLVNNSLFKGLNREQYLLDSVVDIQIDPQTREVTTSPNLDKRERVFKFDDDDNVIGVDKLVYDVVKDLVLMDVQGRGRMSKLARGSSPTSSEIYDGSVYADTMSRVVQDLRKFQSKVGSELSPDALFLHPDLLEPALDGSLEDCINPNAKYRIAEKAWHMLQEKIINEPLSIEYFLGIPKENRKEALNLLKDHYDNGNLHKLFELMGENRTLFKLEYGDDVQFPPISNFLLKNISISELFLSVKGWKQLNDIDVESILKGASLDSHEIGKKLAELIDKGYSLSKLSRGETLNKVRMLFIVYTTALVHKYEHSSVRMMALGDAKKVERMVIENLALPILQAVTLSNLNESEGPLDSFRYKIFSDLFTEESFDAYIVTHDNEDDAMNALFNAASTMDGKAFYKYVIESCGLKMNNRLKLKVDVEETRTLMFAEKRHHAKEDAWSPGLTGFIHALKELAGQFGWGDIGRDLKSTVDAERGEKSK